MTSCIVHAPGSSEGDIRYILVERHPDGGAWLEITTGGESLGVDLGPQELEELAKALGGVA